MRAGSGEAVVFVLLAIGIFAFGAAAIGTGATAADPAAEPADRCPTGPTEETRERAAELNASDEPRIAGLYPDPITDGNVGEFLVLAVPDPDDLAEANWSVTDGHTEAALPNETAAGRVALSMDPDRTESMTDYPVAELEGHLRLAADGDELAIERDGEVVDRVAYEQASEGERWYRTDGGEGEWWPRGATCRPVETVPGGEVTSFVLPDAPDLPLDTIAAADDRILLAGYTFTDEEIAEALHAAIDRGVEVSVLVEGGPVGGTPDRTEPLLTDLDEAGATVRVLDGEGARYTHHHPKYAVADDRALVTTENWKPSGIGGTSNRGWGVISEEPAIATELAAVFRADAAGHDTVSWTEHRENATFVESDPPGDSLEGDHAPERHAVEETELLLAPDNAEERLVELVASAEEELLIKQVRIGDREFPALEAAIEAAERGVEVKILLDSTWYVEEENRALADRLADEGEELPLEIRLVESEGFESIHAKGVVVDRETAVVGSANWNNASLRDNREVALALHGDGVGSYYADVFYDDWEDEDTWPLPVGLLGAIAIALVVAVGAVRRYVPFGAPERRELDGRSGDPEGDPEPGVGPLDGQSGGERRPESEETEQPHDRRSESEREEAGSERG